MLLKFKSYIKTWPYSKEWVTRGRGAPWPGSPCGWPCGCRASGPPRENKKETGQVLVTLLFFMIIAIVITTSAVIILFVNNQSSAEYLQSNQTYYIAESGIEDALLRLLRNPNFSGETLSVGGGSTIVTISGTNPIYATSAATYGNFSKKIQVTANYVNNILTIQSWQEVF